MKNLSRTDLACESTFSNKKLIFNKDYETKHEILYGIDTFETIIKTKNAERLSGRKIGKYITVYTGKVWLYDEEIVSKIRHVVAQNIKNIIFETYKECNEFLIVGLGNRFITSDSLGPSTIDKMTPNMHIKNRSLNSPSNEIRVALIAPGVVGQTGIETSELIKNALSTTKAKCLILIDALASKSIERLCTTIQISNTGLTPGAGIGDKRQEINKDIIGIPVISIGIPTVVDSATIVYDLLKETKITKIPENVSEILNNKSNFFVSPKDCDIIISSMSELLASSIQSAILNNQI